MKCTICEDETNQKRKNRPCCRTCRGKFSNGKEKPFKLEPDCKIPTVSSKGFVNFAMMARLLKR